MKKNANKPLLIFVGNDYEDQELWYPKYRLIEAGYDVALGGLERGVKYLSKHGYPATADAAVSSLKAKDFSGVVAPGGWMPDKLRRDAHVQRLVREFHSQKKLIAAICHGGWIPISAGVYAGVNVTGSAGIKDDLVNAGAKWHDEAVVVDGHFVSSRKPDDCPAFLQGILDVLEGKRRD